MPEREIAVMGTAQRAIGSHTLPLEQVQPQPAPLSSPGVLILSLTREVLDMTRSAPHIFG
jgi:hypothetical protein